VDCAGGGDDTGGVAPTPTGSDTGPTGDTGLATTPTDPTAPGPTGDDDDDDDTDELPDGERPDVATQQLAPAPSAGCGCATGGDAGAWLLGLAALGLGRRRWP